MNSVVIKELYRNSENYYRIFCEFFLVLKKKNLRAIIENPYSTTHYLTKYWAIPSKIIDKDRRTRGDYFQKPTQYWFINCEPKYNMILEPQVWNETKTIENTSNKTERSLISKDYANRFIREFIL